MMYVLTLNWNGEDKLKKLYSGLKENLENVGPYKWLVKDNASVDNSVSFLESLENVDIIKCSHNNDSFAVGVNILLERAKELGIKDDDYILLLNNDLYFKSSKTIQFMVKLFKDDVGVVGNLLLYPDGKFVQHAGVTFFKRHGGLPYHYMYKEAYRGDIVVSEHQAVTGALLLTKYHYIKQFVNESGRVGLNEEFVWAFEDIDYCLRVYNNLGKKILCSNIPAYHEESASLKKNPVQKKFENHNFSKFRSMWSNIVKYVY